MSRRRLRPLSFLSCRKLMRHRCGQVSQIIPPSRAFALRREIVQRTAAEGNFGKSKSRTPAFSNHRASSTFCNLRGNLRERDIHEIENCCCCLRRAWRCCSHLDCGFRNAEWDPKYKRDRRANFKYPAGALGQRPEGPSRVAWGSATLRGCGSATLRRCGSAPRVASGSGMAQRPRLGRTAGLAAASVA